MALLKSTVIEALRSAGRPLKAKDLARELDLPNNEYREFRAFLRHLERAGEIFRVKGGKYAPPDAINLVAGHLSVIKSGAAFLIPEKPGVDDIYVPAGELGTALHGDKVMVRRESSRRGRSEGHVVQVLERARSEFLGTVERGEHFVTVSPDDPRFRKDIFIPMGQAGEARDGEKVVVEITDWGSVQATPVGKVIEVLGMPGEPGLDVLMIVKHNGLDTEFPAEVEAAAAAIPDTIPKDEIDKRVDLRKDEVVTIDPVNARDFDDALSLRQIDDDTLEVGIHIADVSHYVRMDDVIDQEAWRRATSVYLVDRVLPMLPEKLSNELCSLNPDVDRLAMSAIIRITPRGKVLETRIEDTVIRSKRRLTYEQVQGFFDGDKDMHRELQNVAPLLERLRKLAGVLHTKRERRGALDFDLPSSRVELDDKGLPVDIRKVIRLESHRLVEEFMLLANEEVARHLKAQKHRPALYRVHEDPAEQKLEDLNVMLGRFGLQLNPDSKGRIPPRELQRVLAEVDEKPEEQIVNMLVLRSLARARYDPLPLGHYGLALKDYTHFTSPIRRYPDLIVHRTLRFLSGRQESTLKNAARYREWISDTAVHASERERLAESAERDSIELKKIQFMERHLGEVFVGTVTGVQVFGFFVELDDFHVSGLVHISTLEDDYYDYREDAFALVGSSTGRKFTMGDRVRVQVLSAKKEIRQIDFLLDEKLGENDEAETERPARRQRRAKAEFEGKAKSKRRPQAEEPPRRGGKRRRKSGKTAGATDAKPGGKPGGSQGGRSGGGSSGGKRGGSQGSSSGGKRGGSSGSKRGGSQGGRSGGGSSGGNQGSKSGGNKGGSSAQRSSKKTTGRKPRRRR